MDIEIKSRNHIKEFFQWIHGRMEDMAFSVILHIPEKLIPKWLMNKLEGYLNRRISEIKQQTVKLTWRKMYLQNAATEIHNRQQGIKETPPED